MSIRFIRPFVWIEEGQMQSPCLIAFCRFPVVWSEEFNTENPHTVTRKVAQYSYRLYINLFLFELKFAWRFPKVERNIKI